jgi:alpha-D-ribose 1-methylphosphonate 5-triphosphate diphosphatase
MFDTIPPAPLTLSGATVVTPEGPIEAALRIEDGRIAGLAPSRGEGMALPGHYLVPGIVDLHTDHVEAHVYPRSTVQWPFLQALMAHDAVVISGGTTTVFDSLSVGASMKRPERREILGPLVDALEHGVTHGMFRADHLLHLRCEISDPTAMTLVDDTIGRPLSRLVSIMDHTPGDRQSIDLEKWFRQMIREMEIDEAEGRARTQELLDRSARVGAEVRAHVIAAAKAHGVPMMSHDDRTEAHADQAHGEGVAISEFPTTLEAARRSRALGQAIVAGAPNILRGGSQSGNVAVRQLLEEGLVDALASDYIPRSPLEAAFAIAADTALPHRLQDAIAMVSDRPARMTGLTDRGRIEEGLRADLTAVRLVGGQPVVSAVWREGVRVY